MLRRDVRPAARTTVDANAGVDLELAVAVGIEELDRREPFPLHAQQRRIGVDARRPEHVVHVEHQRHRGDRLQRVDDRAAVGLGVDDVGVHLVIRRGRAPGRGKLRFDRVVQDRRARSESRVGRIGGHRDRVVDHAVLRAVGGELVGDRRAVIALEVVVDAELAGQRRDVAQNPRRGDRRDLARTQGAPEHQDLVHAAEVRFGRRPAGVVRVFPEPQVHRAGDGAAGNRSRERQRHAVDVRRHRAVVVRDGHVVVARHVENRGHGRGPRLAVAADQEAKPAGKPCPAGVDVDQDSACQDGARSPGTPRRAASTCRRRNRRRPPK